MIKICYFKNKKDRKNTFFILFERLSKEISRMCENHIEPIINNGAATSDYFYFNFLLTIISKEYSATNLQSRLLTFTNRGKQNNKNIVTSGSRAIMIKIINILITILNEKGFFFFNPPWGF